MGGPTRTVLVADDDIGHLRMLELVLGAHLVWDEGFGEGWDTEQNPDPAADLWSLDKKAAETLLFGTARSMVKRYRGQLAAYATLARGLGPEPVRAGLYFPLLGVFREV